MPLPPVVKGRSHSADKRETAGEKSTALHRVYGTKKDASFQVIVLGSSGGPREDTVTGLLIRAPQSEWRKSSVIAVDAGAHLASIIAILREYMPSSSTKVADPGYAKILKEGPFAGIRFPFISAKANALHVFRELLHSFLITHPHLDHIAAMGINTPALEFGREAKAIVALPPVIDAIKAHIFNDSIWPNLSDENHGVGFVTYRRLTEGGNQRLGSGDARGYVSVCDGLATKCLAVTHGKCEKRNHSFSHQRGESGGWFANDYSFPSRRMSRMSDDHGYFAAVAQQQAYSNAAAQMQMTAAPLTPALGTGPPSVVDGSYHHEPVTSSAFFIRNDVTGKEILVFGDIEPDSVSMAPRNYLVWDEAAPKIVNGTLKAIFIECSYTDGVRDADLFGHLCPRHLIAELEVLARRVMVYREKFDEPRRRSSIHFPTSPQMQLKEPLQTEMMRKRKRGVNGDAIPVEPEASPRVRAADSAGFITPQYVGSRTTASQPRRRASKDIAGIGLNSPLARPLTPSRVPRHVQFHGSPRLQSTAPQAQSGIDPSPVSTSGQAETPSTALGTLAEAEEEPRILPEPLKGFTVHVIHVKDTMVDGPAPGEIIAQELEAHAAAIKLGCEFDVTECGESIWI